MEIQVRADRATQRVRLINQGSVVAKMEREKEGLGRRGVKYAEVLEYKTRREERVGGGRREEEEEEWPAGKMGEEGEDEYTAEGGCNWFAGVRQRRNSKGQR